MEDVDALKKRFKEEAYLFVVDSAKRDKYAYTNPSEYTIQFNAPFKNVIGIELLDASIPRTEYIIDTACNTLVYTLDNVKKTAVVPPGDYNLLQLCDVLTEKLDGGLVVEPISTPYAQTSTVKFRCDASFTLHLSESSIRTQLGFSGTEKNINAEISGTSTTTRSYLGPYPGYEEFLIEPGSTLRQEFVPTISGTLGSLILYLNRESSTGNVTIRVEDDDGHIYGTALVSPSGNTQVDFVAIDGTLSAGQTYYMYLEADDGATVFVNSPATNAYTSSSSEGPWTSIGNGVACEIWSDVAAFEVASTGLVDLSGVRYVMVRCPEIETYLYRERAYEPFYAGLGMVKLGGNGMRQQRFDFVSFPPRTLTTPLGKLSALSFKLEKPDGTLYDSKGIDHTLVMVIRYYAGVKAESTPEQHHILNPHYTANPVTYLEQTHWKNEVNAMDTIDAWPRR